MQLRRKLVMKSDLDKMIEKVPASVKDDVLFQTMVRCYTKSVDDYWDLRDIYHHLENMKWLARGTETEVEIVGKHSESYILVMEELSAKLNKKQELVDFYDGLIRMRLNL